MSARTILKFVGITLAWVLSPFFIHAQGLMDPVSFNITNTPDQVKAGEAFTVNVEATIDGDWHLYSIKNEPEDGPVPTTFSAATDKMVLAGEVNESEAIIAHDPNFDTDLGWHTGSATFEIPVAFKTDVQGKTPVVIDVRYMVCNDSSCLPPKTKSLTTAVTVSGTAENVYEGLSSSAASSNGVDTKEKATSEASISQSSSSGLGSDGIFSFLWVAITAGLAALLTPCVFPMVPLTVSFFTKQSQGSHKKAALQALFFGLAIVATFTLLGVLLSLIIGASGANQFASNPWVNLFIGLVLVVFAVSLLGMFELRLPHQFTNYLNRQSNERSGVMGILFMGLTISAVSFSCTAPFVGGVLAATTGGEWFYPIIGMMAFSAAFAAPFVLLAGFPRWLESMPKSGSWMNVVKVLLGFIELAAAFKFFSNADLVWEWNLVTRPLTIAAWIVIFALAGLYTLGFLAIGHEEKPKSISTLRLLVAIPLLAFSLYLIPGLLGSSLGIWDSWLPPKQATDVSVVASIQSQGGKQEIKGDDEGWSDDYQASIEKAKGANQAVFIDFTGYTCTNCRAMESNVFPLDPVQQRFANFEKVRLYTDDGTEGPENQKLQFELTGTVALPTYVIINPHTGRVIAELTGYNDKETFTEFLDRGLSRFKAEARR